MKDNRGATLLELVIGLFISGLVVSAAVMLISVAINSYNKSRQNVQLQIEAQTTGEILKDYVKKAADYDTIDVETDENGNSVLHILIEETRYTFCMNIGEEKGLYLIKSDLSMEEQTGEKILLSKYVRYFFVIKENNGAKSVRFEITFEDGALEYKLSDVAVVRNGVVR